MNNLMISLVVLVLVVYYGGPTVPNILRDNKEMLFGGVGALVLSSFFGIGMEGYLSAKDITNAQVEARDKYGTDCLEVESVSVMEPPGCVLGNPNGVSNDEKDRSCERRFANEALNAGVALGRGECANLNGDERCISFGMTPSDNGILALRGFGHCDQNGNYIPDGH